MPSTNRFASFRHFALRPRVFFLALAAALAITAARYWVLRETGSPRSLADAELSQGARRNAALSAYAARGELGSLVPQSDAILAIHEAFLQRVIDRSLPFHQHFEDGRYVARLDSAAVRLESGLAMVTLSGRGMVAGQEESSLYADLSLRGLMSITKVDHESGTLVANLVITEVSARQSRPEELQTLLNPVVRFFGRLKAEDWNRNRQQVHLPLRIDREIVLPAIDGDVSIPESRIPVSVGISAVTTLEGRMALSLALLPESALGDAREQERRWTPESSPGKETPSWIRGLPPQERRAAEERALATEVTRLARQDPLWQAVVETDHDVVAIVPEPVLSTVVRRVSHRYLHGVEVDIRPKSAFELNEELRLKILDNKMGVGRLKGTVQISHLKGRLTMAGEPHLEFAPPDEMVVTAPVQVLAGQGRLTMNVEWDPALLVSIVCRGFEFDETLAGELLPFRQELTTRIRYTILDSSIVGRPRVQREKIRLPADLTDGSWKKVQNALLEQDRFSRCGMVLNADSALTKLRQLAGRGVRIRLPARMFKPFRFPVMLEDQYRRGGYAIAAHAFDPAIAVTSEYLRFGFRVNLRVSPAAERRGSQAMLDRPSGHR
jgi:hypothetical protein